MIRAAVAIALIAGPAMAQPPCGPRDSIIDQIEKQYGETRRSIGLSRTGSVVEVYSSAETGAWSIVITSPRQISCLVDAGEAFQIEPVVPEGDAL